MSTVRLRPTFRVRLEGDRDRVIAEIRDRLASDPRFAGRWRGKGRWAELHVPHVERRMWSPHLSLRLDEEDEGCCSLFVRFAPDPEVWTFFMFLYVGLAFATVFGGVLGGVQWASDESAWGLWIGAVGVAAIGLIHLAGAAGQRLGQDQMAALRAELDEVIEGLVVKRDGTSTRPEG